MKTIFILMDSLNRHYLNAYGYGDKKVITPNIDRLAAKGVVFENHYCGSLPCMPARRDMFTGRLNFLESPWCPLQPYDVFLTEEMRSQNNVYSHMITDHYHYWEKMGLGYNLPFNTWEFLRGQEGDPLYPKVENPEVPVYRGKNRRQDWINRSYIDLEDDEDYPTPQCFKRAISFIEENRDADNWHLHLEVFDPHEPFLTPTKYREMYSDDWDNRFHFDWPSYAPVDMELEGEDGIRHIRACYAASLTRADVWLGKLLDKMDELDMWKDTAVILTTDHGHLLGEHGYWAKNYMFDYKELVHIPLIIYMPDSHMKAKRVSALTTTIDLMPTIMEFHNTISPESVQGKSLLHLLENDEPHHDAVLYGYFGKDINMTDGKMTYTRQPRLGTIIYNHTATPVRLKNKRQGELHETEMGRFLSYTDFPVYRIPVKSNKHMNAPSHDLLYDISEDPEQRNPISDSDMLYKYEKLMADLLRRYESPKCQFTKVGLD